jgi:hypothetical protein
MSNFDESMLNRLTRLEREVERLRVGDKADSTAFGRPVFLTTPLTSTSWDGDARSTTAKTKVDLSEVFGVPAGVKAVIADISLRDSGSAGATTGCYFILSPNANNYQGIYTYCAGLANDAWTHVNNIVPCNANGDIYFQINASGSLTTEIYLQIWGYWL